MGWERKRGKLMQFNELLLGGDATAFDLHGSTQQAFAGYVYVLTLDADTALPPEAAAGLIGTISHPLNRPRFASDGRVVSGYTVLQPRIEFLPVSAERTRFSRWFTGSDGLDLYTRAVSDPYMDVFGEGLYAGKGIYDVAGFTRTLRGKVPENAILSHDLFEGGSGRAALVTDLVLYEAVPETYLAHSRRARRWIRGDWQLWPFLFGPGLTWVARWAARQNLIRSLAPIFNLFALLLGWTVLPGRPAAWTLVVLMLSATPFLIGVFDALRGTGESGRPRLRDPGGLALHASRWLFELMVLPHAAVVAASAVWLTLKRLFVERRGLLSWRSAADAERDVAEERSLAFWWREMAAAPVTAVLAAAVLLLIRRDGTFVAAPFLAAWALAPLIAWLASRPLVVERRRLTAAQTARVRRIARRTWLFFERFVGPEDNWLPPDHFQEYPNGAVAHRTSPTNIGLLLTTSLGAYDLGFLGARTLIARLRGTLSTIERLERHRGHLLNWYDTKSLQPLAPRYVSTVDSGNLLGSLLVLKAGCAELADDPVVKPEQLDGLATLVELYREASARLPDYSSNTDAAFASLAAILRASPTGPEALWSLLAEVNERALPAADEQVLDLVRNSAQRVAHQRLAELAIWAGRLHAHVQELLRDLEALMPWLNTELRKQVASLRPQATAGSAMSASTMPTYRELTGTLRRQQDESRREAAPGESQGAYAAAIDVAIELVDDLLAGASDIARRAGAVFDKTEFGFLYDHGRSVFRIGFDVDNARLDSHAYDLLASEARVASLLAIATRQAPAAHWLHLARPLSLSGGHRTVLSWSGTMFEYLMPVLFMHTPEDGLQAMATSSAIAQQIAYGEQHGVPWGISESAFALTDAQHNYQYRAFGVPELALARDPGTDLVIAPYATLMALQLVPQQALANLDRIEEIGGAGLYGFYDAIDFTPTRSARGGGPTVVRSYMAHHHGMSFMAIGNLLSGDKFVQRFHADARVQSAAYLLHEGTPTNAPLVQLERRRRAASHAGLTGLASFGAREVSASSTAVEVTTLSNGGLTSLLSNTGGGFSRWRGLDLTRWRNDPTQEHAGHWLYLSDLEAGEYWSATRNPAPRSADKESVTFLPHKVEYRREVAGVASRLEVSVAPEDDVEIRRLELTNLGPSERRLALTSYAEVVLAEHAADARHPAFSNLFIESSFDAELGALIFHRRLREADAAPRYLLEMVVAREPLAAPLEYETDRREFIGRGGDVRRPAGALRPSLGGNLGATLDPVACLRATVTLPPSGGLELAWVTIAADSRPAVLELARRYRYWDSLDIAVAAAEEGERSALQLQAIDSRQLALLDTLLSRVMFPTSAARGSKEARGRNHGAQQGLWAFGISGDNPLLLVKVADVAQLEMARLVLSAHRRWRERGLKIDLVVLDISEGGYRHGTQEAVRALVEDGASGSWVGRSGGIFLLVRARLEAADLTLLEAVAAVSLDAGVDLDRLLAAPSETGLLPAFTASAPDLVDAFVGEPLGQPDDLLLDNGFGGFSSDGKEYVIFSEDRPEPAPPTPAPWINVLANEQFGCLVSEVGSSTTWAVNSSENRLSPWSNDPVVDPSGEVLYLRDEETASVWTPTPRPTPGPGGYRTRHTAGKTVFEHVSHGLEHELTMVVPPDAPVKLVRLTLTNLQPRQRRLTATYYLQWVLGTTPEDNRHHVVAWYDAEHGALMARNPFRADFAPQVAFVAGSLPTHGFTTDRAEFIGREGSLARPAGLGRIGLGDEARPSVDPCAALQLHLELPPGGSQTLHFVVGRGADHEHATALLAEFREGERVKRALRDTDEFWDDLLGAVEVRTPEPTLDLMLNRWLLYQAVAGRLWGRAGFYQASGAFGFRDQLQDVMALLHVRPQWTRDQLLNAARHQFEEGDVLHWWHPPRGQGVRTRFSDDLAWLPFVAASYVAATADAAVLDEVVPYLSAPELPPGVHESYDRFPPGQATGSLFEHCVRALERATTTGAHGLPLMGSGDWNDGMSRVGADGRGESVWLAFFLATTLRAFATLCDARGADELAQRFRGKAAAYQAATEANAWDGAWYLRAFYDDGTPLGSHASDEAKIDVIAQAWSVLSGEADESRRATAMRSAEERLVLDDESLILLLTPPFDDGAMDPGYIKGYPPGVRENGGQYTHAAIWFAWATAQEGHADRAMALFRMLNPAERTAEHPAAAHYRVEPYVVAADVYGWPPHVGRGGWTWYTGSAGWLYRLGIERLLGLKRLDGGLDIAPVIPDSWPGFTVSYRHGSSSYLIEVERERAGGTAVGLELDGRRLAGTTIPLADAGRTHRVRVVLPRT
ncbi:MAG TPA: glucoamylase family protein [Trueperaceae bacterium]|nr:glucoamylase family protein [Trueperaceae bacterium]